MGKRKSRSGDVCSICGDVELCSICGCTIEGEGIIGSGYFSICPVAFCTWCYLSMCKMIKERGGHGKNTKKLSKQVKSRKKL